MAHLWSGGGHGASHEGEGGGEAGAREAGAQEAGEAAGVREAAEGGRRGAGEAARAQEAAAGDRRQGEGLDTSLCSEFICENN